MSDSESDSSSDAGQHHNCNPYDTPVKVFIERSYSQEDPDDPGEDMHIQSHEEKTFSDLQEAYFWCMNQTGIYTFPEGPEDHGEHEGWDYKSYFYLVSRLAAFPNDTFVIFARETDEEERVYAVKYDV